MRRLAVFAVLACSLSGLFFAATASAGESPFLNDCRITSANSSTVASTASDTDCAFTAGRWVTMQCDAAVRYRKDGTDPTSTSPLVNVGDPYPMLLVKDTTVTGLNATAAYPVKILSTNASAANCNFYLADP